MRSFAVVAFCIYCHAQEVTSSFAVRGTVLDEATRQPLQGATVALVGGITGPAATTDSEGAYVIAGLRAGRIFLEVTKDDYATLDPMNSPEAKVDLKSAGEVTRNFQMSLAASITGRVIDSDSERPVNDVRVWSLHEDYAFGIKRYIFFGAASGDKVRDGRFAITKLLPGDYLIEVDPEVRQKLDTRPSRVTEGEMLAYPHSYFPDVPRIDMATTISVAAGEKRGLTIRVRRKPVRAVRGSVELPKGVPGPISYLVAVEGPGFTKHITQGKWPVEGPFQIEGLSEGEYTLLLSTEDDAGKTACFLQERIVIGNRDVENLRLHLSPGLAVSGHLLSEKDEPPLPSSSYEIALQPIRQTRMVGENLNAAVQDGNFRWGSVLKGNYFARLRNLPPGWAVSRFIYQSVDRRDKAISVDGSAIDGSMNVYVTSKLSTISGRLQDSSGSAKSATLVLVPDDLPDDYDPSSIKMKATDENGRFVFSDVLGGRYNVLSLYGAEAKSARDLRFLRTKFVDAELVEVVPGQNALVRFRDR